MSANKIERAGFSNVITMQADDAILKGSPVTLVGAYLVDNAAAADIHIGIALEAAAAQYDMIPVLVFGPVVRLTAGDTIAAGGLCSAAADTGDGLWYPTPANSKCVAISIGPAEAAVTEEFDAIVFHSIKIQNPT